MEEQESCFSSARPGPALGVASAWGGTTRLPTLNPWQKKTVQVQSCHGMPEGPPSLVLACGHLREGMRTGKSVPLMAMFDKCGK